MKTKKDRIKDLTKLKDRLEAENMINENHVQTITEIILDNNNKLDQIYRELIELNNKRNKNNVL